MSSLAVLQPVLTDSFTFYYDNTTNTVTVTVAEILEKIKSIDNSFDSFFIGTLDNGAYWKGLYYITPFTVGTKDDFYIADGEFLQEAQGFYQNSAWAQNTASYHNRRYRFNSSRNLIDAGSSTKNLKTYNDIGYVRDSLMGAYTGSYQVCYIGGEVTHLYINETPYVQYQWTSVPAISGNNETHILAQVDSESINDGEPVSDLVASDFIALPDAIKVKALADARVLE